LELDVFPWMGGKPVAEITAPVVLEVLRRIESRGVVDTAHRAKQTISQVMRYAIATGRVERDPCPDLKGALPARVQNHFASLTNPTEAAALLRAIDQYSGGNIVRAALKLAPLVFVRPGELRVARWADIDLDKAEWRYLVTKTKTDHLVPLSQQAVAVLRDLHPLTGQGDYVFPGMRAYTRPMSDGAINRALQSMGYSTKNDVTVHGFRAMVRTLLAEELHFPPEVIEHQLAHRVPDALGTAYNRTKFLKERTLMMQVWADYLDKLKAGAAIIPIHGNAESAPLAPNDAELEVAVAAAEATWAKPRTRANSKQAEVVRMLQRPEGATVRQICETTGWQTHTVRGAFAGAFKKKLGLTLVSDKEPSGERVCRVA
jgi:integrase